MVLPLAGILVSGLGSVKVADASESCEPPGISRIARCCCYCSSENRRQVAAAVLDLSDASGGERNESGQMSDRQTNARREVLASSARRSQPEARRKLHHGAEQLASRS